MKYFLKFLSSSYNIKFLYYVDFVENHTLWNDRGGALEELSLEERRTEPCLEPDRFIGIDYNGKVMPCCVTRSDIDTHQDFILGDTKTQNINEIFNSEKAVRIRKKAMEGNFDDEMKPCHYCPYELKIVHTELAYYHPQLLYLKLL